ncbi:MAG TPA: hypothetical protein DCR97_11530 [Deltaproteobacteria bacterium]|nr:hypothetical protein [Deltaproteobacteria bacterium]
MEKREKIGQIINKWRAFSDQDERKMRRLIDADFEIEEPPRVVEKSPQSISSHGFEEVEQ